MSTRDISKACPRITRTRTHRTLSTRTSPNVNAGSLRLDDRPITDDERYAARCIDGATAEHSQRKLVTDARVRPVRGMSVVERIHDLRFDSVATRGNSSARELSGNFERRFELTTPRFAEDGDDRRSRDS